MKTIALGINSTADLMEDERGNIIVVSNSKVYTLNKSLDIINERVETGVFYDMFERADGKYYVIGNVGANGLIYLIEPQISSIGYQTLSDTR